MEINTLLITILSEKFDAALFQHIDDATWNELFGFARKSGLYITLYNILMRHKIPIPEDIAQKLKKTCYSACAADAKRKKQLKEIIRLFNDNGIDHILLKGSALISTVYKDSFCRPMCDIDILVHKEDADRAFSLLLGNGYCDTHNSTDNYLNHYPPLRKRNGLNIEMHTDIIEGITNNNLGKIWSRARIISPSTPYTKVMCPEDLIFHIALHKFYIDTAMNGFLGLYDISQIIKAYSIDWNRLSQLTRENEYNMKNCLFLVLFLTSKLLKSEINTECLNSIKPESYSNNLEQTVVELLFYDSSNLDIEAFKLDFLIRNAKKTSLKSTLRRLFMPPEKARTFFKSKSLTIFYIKRIILMWNRYKKILFKRLFSNNVCKESKRLAKSSAELKSWLSN